MLLVDTGVLLAAADSSDRDHTACAELLQGAERPLLTSPLVVAETGYLIERQLGPRAEAEFYRSIAAGDLTVATMTADLWARTGALIDDHADLPLGGADASLVALAELHSLDRIGTLDRRHFSVVQPSTGSLRIASGLMRWRPAPKNLENSCHKTARWIV